MVVLFFKGGGGEQLAFYKYYINGKQLFYIQWGEIKAKYGIPSPVWQ